MSVNVTFGAPGNFPIGFCWTNPQDFLNNASALLVATINGMDVVISASAPEAADQDKLWARLVGNQLEGLYAYSGGWFRSHPLAPSTAFRTIWRDTEANLWSADGGDGTNPLVSAPTLTTGSFWQRDLDFGSDDGTTCFRFPVGVGLNPTAYDGNPASAVTLGDSSLGEQKHKLLIDKIPAHTHALHEGAVEHGAADHTVFQPTTSDAQPDGVTGAISGGTAPNDAHNNLPPYLGVFFVKRTARQFIQAS